MSTRKFQLSVPCVEFDIDEYKHLSFEKHIDIYMNLFMPHIKDDEAATLRSHQSYVRFMCFQDDDDTKSYMYAYVRPISSMMPEHRQKAQVNTLMASEILGEINYATNGYFFSTTLEYAY